MTTHTLDSEELVRLPAVAGRFYPSSADALERTVLGHLAAGRTADDGARGLPAAPTRAIAAMAPHAGLVYSGPLAGRVFAAVEIPGRVIVLAPNHTGRGRRIAVAARGVFRLPVGDVPIDDELAARVLAEVPGASADLEAHRLEHAIEVELPFLLARRPDVRIVPIVLGGLDADEAIAVGEGLARAVAPVADDVLVVASSDMSHYLTDVEARAIDRIAIDALLGGDPAALHRTVRRHDISMCGVVPATAMLAYARARGGGRPELVGYTTSAEAFGDTARVVGYAGVVVRPAESH